MGKFKKLRRTAALGTLLIFASTYARVPTEKPDIPSFQNLSPQKLSEQEQGLQYLKARGIPPKHWPQNAYSVLIEKCLARLDSLLQTVDTRILPDLKAIDEKRPFQVYIRSSEFEGPWNSEAQSRILSAQTSKISAVIKDGSRAARNSPNEVRHLRNPTFQVSPSHPDFSTPTTSAAIAVSIRVESDRCDIPSPEDVKKLQANLRVSKLYVLRAQSQEEPTNEGLQKEVEALEAETLQESVHEYEND